MAESLDTSAREIPYPYAVGSILRANTTFAVPGLPTPTEQYMRVKQLIEPQTLSCCMIVEILEGPNSPATGTEAFLKLYDWRFATDFRKDFYMDLWSADVERKYVEGLPTGRLHEFSQRLRYEKNFRDETENEWDEAEDEAFLVHEMQKAFDAEVATYARLAKYQGDVIPHFLGELELDFPLNYPNDTTQERKYKVKGVLLELIPGFSLSDMIKKVRRSSWKGIVDQTIQLTRVLDDNNVEDKYEVYMVGFAQCRLCGEDESDLHWGRAKHQQDEEGAVGAIMEMRLEQVGYKLDFKPLWKYIEWAPGENDEDWAVPYNQNIRDDFALAGHTWLR
ncbi:hypothetical protein FBEOM_3746 [Fusarium beomiforme]|uniref:Uncharacterized protein n=1 Tax=Fusarium beomiforme TaxID=44412 RepID=A0A9P5APE9_9HYPO|nr:hypothetical protein FBEOM_3746 [Fusarium beomiforme]